MAYRVGLLAAISLGSQRSSQKSRFPISNLRANTRAELSPLKAVDFFVKLLSVTAEPNQKHPAPQLYCTKEKQVKLRRRSTPRSATPPSVIICWLANRFFYLHSRESVICHPLGDWRGCARLQLCGGMIIGLEMCLCEGCWTNRAALITHSSFFKWRG